MDRGDEPRDDKRWLSKNICVALGQLESDRPCGQQHSNVKGARAMDILGWVAWAVGKTLGFAWAVVWFLLGGWVAALAQIVVVVGIVFAMKYGWRRAPMEMLARGRTLARFVWGWARAQDFTRSADERNADKREAIRIVRTKEPGDVSISTLLTVIMLLGMLIAGAL